MIQKSPLTIEDVLRQSFRLLSRRMYTAWEFRKKLQEKGISEGLIEEALALLGDNGYLDDRTYVSAYIEEKRRIAPRGYFAFYQELKRRGIPAALLDELRSMYPLEAEIEDVKRLLSLWKVAGSERGRIWRRLLGRGFSREAIERAILDLPGSGD